MQTWAHSTDALCSHAYAAKGFGVHTVNEICFSRSDRYSRLGLTCGSSAMKRAPTGPDVSLFLSHGLRSVPGNSVHQLGGAPTGASRMARGGVDARLYMHAGLTKSHDRWRDNRSSACSSNVRKLTEETTPFGGCDSLSWGDRILPTRWVSAWVRSTEEIRNDADSLNNQLVPRWGLWLSDCRSVNGPSQDQQRFNGERIFLAAAECRPPSEACVSGFSDPRHAGRIT